MVAVRARLGAVLAQVALGLALTSAGLAQPAGAVPRAIPRRLAEERALQRSIERAEQALAAGRLDRALSLLERAARRTPRDARAALRFCDVSIPETDETVRALVEGSERIVADAGRCHELLALHADALATSVAPEAAERMAWARALGGDRAPALARAASRPLDERDVPALRRLAVLALRDEALEDAETALILARRVRPSDLELTSELGAVRLARGDAPSAVTLFRAVVAGRPADPEALHDLAGACLQVGETATAVRYLESLAAREPDVASRWLELALARIELGAYASAAADARRAMELAPEDAAAPLALGDALHLAGDAVGARSAYEEALRRDPGSVRARRAIETLSAAQ